MRGKEAGLYRGNGTKDEGTLRSKRLITKWSPCVPTKLMTLGQFVSLGTSLRREVEPSLHESVQGRSRTHRVRGQLKSINFVDDESIWINLTELFQWVVSLSTWMDPRYGRIMDRFQKVFGWYHTSTLLRFFIFFVSQVLFQVREYIVWLTDNFRHHQ